jgi:hypothetical protein
MRLFLAGLIMAAGFVCTHGAIASSGGGVSKDRHEVCLSYSKIAEKVADRKTRGADRNLTEAEIIGQMNGLRYPNLAKKVMDISSYVYSKSMSRDQARDSVYEMCTSGILDKK